MSSRITTILARVADRLTAHEPPLSDATCVWQAAAALGECPVWHAGQGALYWTDIVAGALHRLRPESGERSTWPMGSEIGALALHRNGGLVAALGTRIVELDAEGAIVREIACAPDDPSAARLNDGACDGTGALWTGSMDRCGRDPIGSLYRIDAAGNLGRSQSDLTIPNGPALDAANRIVYLADSPLRVVYAFDSGADGRLSRRRIHIRFGPGDGYPDGLEVDAEGHLWIAHYGGWRISRFRPDGRLDFGIGLPAENVTACAFGGAALDRLYVTSARQGLDDRALRRQPLAGGLFELSPGIRGMPARWFGCGDR